MALDRNDLIQKLEDQVNTVATSTIAPSIAQERPKILGVFTGQGAQAARMGYALLQHCNLFQESIKKCDLALKSIPSPPEWSISEELAADSTTSRTSQAKFSQPLCTAIQIGLVDLLRASGIHFSAVVGHSSGEIGAAYAAGLLSKKDAMGIAYYRGHVAHLARGGAGQKGGMIAAATSSDDAVAICSEPQFKGRITVAASNSPASTTMSGDEDAVAEMKAHLAERDIQARALQVDTAYHSHHMFPCAEAYLGNLKQLNVRVQTPAAGRDCRWYSSVRPGTDILDKPLEAGLESQYWVDNMVQPVYFSQAVKHAVQAGATKLSASIEVGPHPALKGPFSQTLKQSIDYTPGYASCLSRDKDAMETFSDAIATLWKIAPSSIDFAGWRKAFGLVAQPQTLKDLPPYAWDHSQVHWRESRVVNNYRLGKRPPHDLLGRLWNDSQYEHTWRNIFQLSEMPWVKGHVFQNQVLFPATGYIGLAVDAAKAFVNGRPIKLLEVRDMAIPTALVIGERDEVEVLFAIRSKASPDKAEDGSVLETEFACYSYPDQREADRTCHGRLLIQLGEPGPEDLAPVHISDVNLTPFNVDRFYSAASEIGFQYEGCFRAITSLNRCWGHAKAVASWSTADLDVECSLHPAILDVTLQAGLATFLSAAENSMASSYLPVGITRAIINPNDRFRSSNESTCVDIEAYMASPGLGKLMKIDINVRDQMGINGDICGIQMEGVKFKAISEPQPSEDRNILAKTVWGLDSAYGLVEPAQPGASSCDEYISQLAQQISHKFPRTNVLEFSAGTGNTTSSILDAIGDAYESYTCAGASETITLDIEAEVTSPENDDAPLYDVVVVSSVLRASQNVTQIATNLRKLLRPGGFLIATVLTGTSLRPVALMDGSEDWSAGSKSERTERYDIKTGDFDKLLHQSGFSGIDCISHEHLNASFHGLSVLSTQAVDDRFEILRDPIPSLEMITPSTVFIIGGETSRVSAIVGRLDKLLRGWASGIHVHGRFSDVDASRIPPGSSVICLQELDKPLLSYAPTETEMTNLKEVLAASKNTLWVTSGRLLDDPFSNIMIGIGRSLRLELPNLNLHYLDLEGQDVLDVQLLMRQFLRLVFASSSPTITEGMLWVEEPEVVTRDSRMMVARVVVCEASNEIYNAGRRRIAKPVGPAEPIEFIRDTQSAESTLACSRAIDIPEDHVPVQVKLSIALHSYDQSPRFLSYGRLRNSDKPVLTLSMTDSSIVTVQKGLIFGSEVGQEVSAETLANLANCLIASHIISRLPSHGTILVCGASEDLSKVISSLAAKSERKVLFVAVTEKLQSDVPGWINIHPKASARDINKLIPRDSNTFFGLSQKDVDTVLPYLLTNCAVMTLDTEELSQQSVEEAIAIYQAHKNAISAASSPPTVVKVEEVTQKRHSGAGHLSVVTNWDRESPVSAAVRPLDPHTLISPNKTYFLVGMAGDLGQSLTYFLVRGGARHIVLSSRNPKQQPWAEALRAEGVDVRLVKMDVTDRSQVQETVAMLRRTMPEIGGVTNAALVLEPGVFANLSAESIWKQLRPKVFGSVHLDEEFKNDKLDFFLTFGSLLTVCGNAGQPMYHAGNTFMASLVQNRRRRGLAASILNFGMLVDVGYVARSDRSDGSNVEEWLRSFVPTALSEADFHHVILQGIVEGNPESGSGGVIMGLETFEDRGQPARPSWVSSSFLSHMVRASKSSIDAAADSTASSAQQWQQSLDNASTIDEAIAPITELLSQKIESMIHVSLHSIHPDEPLSNLGLDSINAIEIRKWLREKIGADISMLRIVGRDSSSSIILSIAEQYMAKKQAQGHMPAREESQNKAAVSVPKSTRSEEKQSIHPYTSTPSQGSQGGDVSTTPSRQSSRSSIIMTPDPELETEYLRSERLSYVQAGWFYLNSISSCQSSFNLTVKVDIKGELSIERFGRAFDATMLRYDALQTQFLLTSGSLEPQQYLTAGTKTSRLARMQSTGETAKADVHKIFSEISKHEYSLSTGDTSRAALISHDKQSHTLVLGFHNIAIDAFSMAILVSDISRAYQYQPLSPNPTSYLDFTRQQVNDIQGGRFDDNITYWKQLLDPLPEALPLLPLAKVKTRRVQRAYGHHYIEKVLSRNLVQRVGELIQAHGVTPMQFYLSALQVLLCRMLNIDDVRIGVVYNGRDPTSKFAATVGHLADVLPIPSRGVLGKSFSDVLKQTTKTLLDSLDNANIPFAALLERIRLDRSEGNMPLFQVAYDYRGAEETKLSPIGDCVLSLEELDYTTLYDMTVDVLQTSSGNHVLNIRCSDDFYSFEATELVTETFINVLESLAREPDAAVMDCNMVSNDQIQKAVNVAHGPDFEYSWPNSLSTRFEQVAARFPESVAVKHGNETITYHQLRRKAGLYASILVDSKVTTGSRVAVLCEPSIDLYAVMLAVFHVGAIYVPLDISLPDARRKDILKVCSPDVLVFHAATARSVADGELKSLNITKLAQASRQDAPVPAHSSTGAGSDSCILFTSGSTGVPKGIRLHQRSLMSFAQFASKTYGFGQIKVLQQTSIGFDLSLAQIYTAFTNGGSLVVVPVEARGDPEMLSKLMVDNKIEYTMCTPSEYSLLLTYAGAALQQCHSWTFAGTAGEPLSKRVIDGLRGLKLPNLTLTDCYGPTEAFIVTCRDVTVKSGASYDESEDKIGSIGHILPNTSIHITSETDGSLLPLGMPGEICIGGGSVANGYLDSELTASMFVKDPFANAKHTDRGFDAMYKSGDRGVLHADGTVVLLGRTQGGNAVVKLRGLRIDLGEVRGAILEAAPDALADAAVTIRGNPQLLICHVVFKHGKTLGNEQLTELLQTMTLPRYMVPSAIVPLERLPVTSNGKLDVAALQALQLPSVWGPGHDEVEMTETEATLRKLWIDVIGTVAETTDIGPGSSFFLVGGNSLHLVHLKYAIERKIGVNMPLRLLAQTADLRAMAVAVEKALNSVH